MITKALLAKELREPGLSYRDASVYIDVIFKAIGDMLAKGESIQLRGFGSFYVVKKAAHKTGVNDGMEIPEHGRVIFRPYDKLRKAVWNIK